MGIKSIYFPALILWSENAYQNMNYYLEISPPRPANFNGLKKKIKKKPKLLKCLFTRDHFKLSEQFKTDFQRSVFIVHTLLQLVLNTEQLQCKFI